MSIAQLQAMAATASASGANSQPAVQPRLVKAAHEFEAQMMKELMKPMTGTALLGDDDDDSGSGGALGEFASESLGKALSAKGGFGIADRIVNDLSHSGKKTGSANGTGNFHQ